MNRAASITTLSSGLNIVYIDSGHVAIVYCCMVGPFQHEAGLCLMFREQAGRGKQAKFFCRECAVVLECAINDQM